jgi:hypothetical protein
VRFLADLLLVGGTNRTVKITLQSDTEQPLPGGFSDILTVQVCPPIPVMSPALVRGPNNTLTVSWTGGGVLQCTPSLTPPLLNWADVAGATSPYTTTAGGPMRFYRVVVP